MKELERLLTRVAKLNSTVLITGETGSGKEVAARFLHAVSGTDDRPFMAVNCAAIPGDLLESELLGHEKGAFTSASQRHLGYAERAGEGVLFLDEIGELRSELQAKLLRLIEDKSFYRIGGERPVPFKGRLVVATNADLPKLVQTGRFREDLYYRINVVSVRIPPLRDRQQDIPWLMERFFAESAGRMETSLKGISSLAEEAALSYGWPGNIRELRNRMERAVVLGTWTMGDARRFVSGAERRYRPGVANGIARGHPAERGKAPHPPRAGGHKRRSRCRIKVARNWAHHPLGKDASPRIERRRSLACLP